MEKFVCVSRRCGGPAQPSASDAQRRGAAVRVRAVRPPLHHRLQAAPARGEALRPPPAPLRRLRQGLPAPHQLVAAQVGFLRFSV